MPLNVVFIEDNKEIQEVVEDVLHQSGDFRVVASHGTEPEALAWVFADPDWDLAIVDLVLREGSGFNLIRHLRAARGAGSIMVLSDYASPAIKLRCIELGADAVFTKGEVKAFQAFVARLQSTVTARPRPTVRRNVH